jgi:hypothetical protein
MCQWSRCSEATAEERTEIARSGERRNLRSLGSKLAHPIGRRLGAQHDVPQPRGDAENRVRLGQMVREMARAQALFERARWDREMNPVMNELVHSESRKDPAKKDHPRPEAENRQQRSEHDGSRDIRMHREDGSRIAMMHVMQRRHERPVRMPKHPVNDVLDESPRENPGTKNQRIRDHEMILRRRNSHNQRSGLIAGLPVRLPRGSQAEAGAT